MDQDLLKELTEDQQKEFQYYASANFTLVKRIYNRKDIFTTFKPNTEIAYFAHHPQKGTYLITGSAPMDWINFAINDPMLIDNEKSDINTQLSLF